MGPGRRRLLEKAEAVGTTVKSVLAKGQRVLLQLLPCTHVARVQHEDATRGFRLVHNWTKGNVLLVQGDLQGLAAAAEEEEGAQEPHAFHEHFLGEEGDTLLRGKDDFQLTDFFGLQRDVVEWYQGDDLGKVTTRLSAEGRGSRSSFLEVLLLGPEQPRAQLSLLPPLTTCHL
uniref:Uncharacterized protein n=1 Tax=Molossus molossus TaxID=27622 RepID=A0A7J8C8X7_MOLMO|nr:hypothetical protein HJG59_009949 [Molossus molossus]